MDSYQLETHMRQVLASLKNKKYKFGGVLPADYLKQQKPELFTGYIINTDDSQSPGQHWIAIYIANKDTVEYFDSYGIGPHAYKSWMCWIRKYFKFLKYNIKPVQTVMSAACGAHCLFYLYHRMHAYSMDAIMNEMYHNIREYNDLIVELDLEKHLKDDIVIDESILKRLIPQNSKIMTQ